MKIAIVGAGIAGLTSIRQAIEYNLECVAFEISEYIGGTWVYHEDGENGIRDQLVPNSMYYNLRTLLPGALMEFRGYKFEPKSGQCYPHRTEVLEYIENFARDFNLANYIKFAHKVTNISRQNDKWILAVKNLKTGRSMELEFDAVMVCSGHNSVPNYPDYPGMDTFPGYQTHSYYYRKNDRYKDQIVLLIGSGPSAADISLEIAEVATKVIFSHGGNLINTRPKNIIQKPKVKMIDQSLIYFEDDTTESVNAIVYCTGYKYEYPFLDPSCGITNEDMILRPLYKDFINANHPTMCLIGLLQKAMVVKVMELQADVFIKLITGHAKLPSKDELLSVAQKEYEGRIQSIVAGNHFYHLAARMRRYFKDLYELGQCEPYPPVLFDIFEKNTENSKKDSDNRRKQIYEIVDDYTYNFRWEI